MPKYVYSSTFDKTDWNTTIRRNVDPEEINELKKQPGGDMAVGGADLAHSMGDLIDEYHVYVHPVLIGAGKPLLRGRRRDLRLVETRTFGNGVVLLRYSSDR